MLAGVEDGLSRGRRDNPASDIATAGMASVYARATIRHLHASSIYSNQCSVRPEQGLRVLFWRIPGQPAPSSAAKA